MGTIPSRSTHQPVLVTEVLAYLVSDPDGAYLDLTAGLGGHLKALSTVLSDQARLYGVDRDPTAAKQAQENLRGSRQRCEIVAANYADIDDLAADFADHHFVGILLDLGLSSAQLDDPERGFSYRFDAPLDMRFDPASQLPTAADLVAALSEEELARILFEYGEERNSRRIARTIRKSREQAMIATTGDLAEIVRQSVPGRFATKSLARVFQALRIAVNSELEQLERLLPNLVSLLTPGGRCVIIAYHSLEDRLVKRFLQRESRPGESGPTLRLLSRKAVQPTAKEVSENPRARSARLRAAERV